MKKRIDEKLPYEPPRMRRVRLIQEELAAKICKTQTSGGPAFGCRRSNCKQRGS
jgi:hypothetical protein